MMMACAGAIHRLAPPSAGQGLVVLKGSEESFARAAITRRYRQLSGSAAECEEDDPTEVVRWPGGMRGNQLGDSRGTGVAGSRAAEPWRERRRGPRLRRRETE